MEEKTEIRISFRDENTASAAYPYMEVAVTCFYLYKEGFYSDSEEAVRDDPFQLYALNCGPIMREHGTEKLLSEHPECAINYPCQDGSDIVLKQCADLQGLVPDLQQKDRKGFFSYLCFLLALIFPVIRRVTYLCVLQLCRLMTRAAVYVAAGLPALPVLPGVAGK